MNRQREKIGFIQLFIENNLHYKVPVCLPNFVSIDTMISLGEY